jgi:hypothetical protein
MPKRIDATEFSAVEAALREKPGIGIAALEKALGPQAPSRRTLLRRLGTLIRQGRAIAEGSGPARVYRPTLQMSATMRLGIRGTAAPALSAAARMGIAVRGSATPILPLSEPADDLLTQVHRPIQRRRPAGYEEDFLRQYRPNRSFYLPEATRHRLHDLGRPPVTERPAGTYARDLLDRLLIDLSWASSRLEGNTYSRLDTRLLIQFGQVAEGKDAAETQMVLNHKRTIEFLVGEAADLDFNVHTILNLHAILADNLLEDQQAGGQLRRRQVAIEGSVFVPLGVPQRIEDCFRILLDAAAAIRDPFEQAFFVMVQLPYLQPFEDVNKRVSRLAANIPLIKRDLCPLSFVDVPEDLYVAGNLSIYELNRIELLRDLFVWAYERSCQQYSAIKRSLAQPDPFRLLHGAALRETVQGMVRGRCPATPAEVTRRAPALPGEAELDRFVEMVLTDLAGLHEGNIARYGLRPSELKAWQNAEARSRGKKRRI